MPTATAEHDPLPSGHGFAGRLFAGVAPADLACARECFAVETVTFRRGDEILSCRQGSPTFGVMDAGTALDVRRYANGERALVDVLEPGDLIGEGWQAAHWRAAERPRERAIIASSAGRATLVDPARIIDPATSCPAQSIVQNNLLRSVLQKHERLRAKLEIVRHRSLRGKIGSFLLVEAQRRASDRFTLPLNRAELAEYLHADRAALSRELARMQHDGLISVNRNSFTILALDEELLD